MTEAVGCVAVTSVAGAKSRVGRGPMHAIVAVLFPRHGSESVEKWTEWEHAMSVASFSNFEGTDFVAFAACGVVGYLLGTLAPEGSGLAIYGSILISYHLFLAWLILFSRGDHKDAGLSLPVGHTLLTHTACLIVILAPIAIYRAMPHVAASGADAILADAEEVHHSIRIFQALCCSIAGLAMFERGWLFSSEKPMAQPKVEAAPVAPIVLQATVDDFEAWRQYLAQKKPGARAAGGSLKTEYEQWLLARQQSRAAQGAGGEWQG